MQIPPLRRALGAHIGQVLTPELACAIEVEASGPANPEHTMAKLRKWRHLIEPVAQSNASPATWAQVERTPVTVYEAAHSVLVVCVSAREAVIWVASGVLDEVLDLIEQATADASAIGCNTISYIGRPGWIRLAGFVPKAVQGIKEI